MSIEGKQAFNEFMYGVKLGAGEVQGAGTSWGSQTIVLTGTVGFPTVTPVVFGPSAGAPVAATVKFAQIVSSNNVAAIWEVASSTNTKAVIVANQVMGPSTLGVVVGATSILNAGIAAGEILKLSTTSTTASATVILGIETAN